MMSKPIIFSNVTLGGEQHLGIDRSKFESLLAKAVQIANERENAAWQIIREMIPVQTPEYLPKNHTLFVGSIAYSMIENTLNYIPLFVKHSILLKPEQVFLASNFVSFDRVDFNIVKV